MTPRYIFASALLSASIAASAQDLNTEITVSHEIVPEEKAATRLRLLPTLTLPKITPGRLPAASAFVAGQLTPHYYMLESAPFASTLERSPWRGYASLGYGPIYNLAASAGYRFVETDKLTLDGYLQFDGASYRTKYPKLPMPYDGKVTFRRNTGLIGANTTWKTDAGALKASVLYQYSDYNFPILSLADLSTARNQIRANVAKVGIGWGNTNGKIDYGVNGNYDMIVFGKDLANNYRGEVAGSFLWHATGSSAWGVDLKFSLDNSEFARNKGIVHACPRYVFTGTHFVGKVGVDIDATTGNAYSGKKLLVAPDLNLTWMPSAFFNMWLTMSGRIDDNYRGRLYDEQPYLLPAYDAGFSRIYSGVVGLTVGPWRGAAIKVYGGYTTAYDWLMPAIETGAMSPVDVKGFHGGVSLSYSYSRILTLNAAAELAQSPDGKYSKGYAPWRDHAKFNLMASATVRPIPDLEISLAYQLRTGREKTLGAGRDLKLLNVNNLKAGVSYSLTRQWSLFLRGENLMNRHWYLGPAVPSQGIMGLIGASYLF